MPFCRNQTNLRFPGPIRNNPLNGLCERLCVEVKKVFDGCVSRMEMDDLTCTLSDFDPPAPAQPLSFVSAQSVGEPTITDLTVTPLPDERNARVQCQILMPIVARWRDANDVEGTALGTITISRDIIMCLPPPSITGYSVEASGSLVATGGTINDDVLTIDCCVVIVTKIIVIADLLVPCYGYTDFPVCEDFAPNSCREIFELPLFPRNRF